MKLFSIALLFSVMASGEARRNRKRNADDDAGGEKEWSVALTPEQEAMVGDCCSMGCEIACDYESDTNLATLFGATEQEMEKRRGRRNRIARTLLESSEVVEALCCADNLESAAATANPQLFLAGVAAVWAAGLF